MNRNRIRPTPSAENTDGSRSVTHISVPSDDDIAWHKALADEIKM